MRIIGILLFFIMYSCASLKSNAQELNLVNIKEAYYQKWVAGIEGGGSGTNFFVTFEKPLDNDIELISVQFNSQEILFEKTSKTEYVAKIQSVQKDLIMDENPVKEYGNQNTIINLKPNQAVLNFQKNGEIYTKKLENVKEKTIVAFPSRNKEKN